MKVKLTLMSVGQRLEQKAKEMEVLEGTDILLDMNPNDRQGTAG